MRTQSTQVSILGAFSFSFKYIDYLQAKAKKEYEDESVQFNYKPSITRNSYTRNIFWFFFSYPKDHASNAIIEVDGPVCYNLFKIFKLLH